MHLYSAVDLKRITFYCQFFIQKNFFIKFIQLINGTFVANITLNETNVSLTNVL